MKKQISKQLASLFQHRSPLILSIIITNLLSSAHIQAAHDPNYKKPIQIAEVARINATQKLFRATLKGTAELALEAIYEHADINAIDTQYDSPTEGNTPLIAAIRNDHPILLKILLAHNALVDKQAKKNYTALLLAAREGYDTIVHLLLEHEANPDLQDIYGSTALLLATQGGHIATVQLLLNHNATIDIQDIQGDTALTKATIIGSSVLKINAQNNNAIIEALILHGANLTIMNNEKLTPLNFATPKIKKNIQNTIAKKIAFEEKLDQQDWDVKILARSGIINTFLLAELALLVHDYANPYHPSEQPLHSAIKRSIYNRRLAQMKRTSTSATSCCATTPDYNCSNNYNKKEICAIS